MDPVGSIEGPRVVRDPMGSAFVSLESHAVFFLYLECKSMADIADFLCGAYLPPPRLIKDSQTSVW